MPPGYRWQQYPPSPRQPPALDRTVAALRIEDDRPWGWRPVALPMVTLIALILATVVISHTVHAGSDGRGIALAAGINVGVELLLAASVWLAGRELAARYGGWMRVFGWGRPVLADLPFAAAGFGIALAARFVVLIAANAATNGKAAEQSQNVSLDRVTVGEVALLVFVAVICAPLIEELVFRGLLLRTFMRRMGFWPAAAASSFIFAVFHTYEVDTLAGAVTLALAVGAMGLTNCALVRYSDRLSPGIAVHATLNGLAVLLLVLIS